MSEQRFILEATIDPGGAEAGAKKFRASLDDVAKSLRKAADESAKMRRDFSSLKVAQDSVARSDAELEQKVRRLEASYRSLQKDLRKTQQELNHARDAKNRSGIEADKLAKRLGSLALRFVGLGASIEAVRRGILGVITAATGFEVGLVGVAKTTDLTDDQLASLGQQIEHLATTSMPTATAGLLQIAQSAGQLGVRGVDNLLAFVKAVGKVVPSTDLTAESAAIAFARVLNVTNESSGAVERFASQIVALGNNFPAVESEILSTTNEVARAIAIFDVGSGAAAGLSTAFASLGIAPEIAATSAGRLFRVIQEGLRDGGSALRLIAKVADRTGEDIKEAFEKDAMGAVTLFLEGLNRLSVDDSARVLDELRLSTDRLDKTIPSLVKRVDLVNKALAVAAADAVAPISELDREFARFSSTTEAQFQILANAFRAFGRDVGEELLPVLREMITNTRQWFLENEDVARHIGRILLGAIEKLGKAVAFLVENFDALVSIAAGFALAKLIDPRQLLAFDLLIKALLAAEKGMKALTASALANPMFAIGAVGTFLGLTAWRALKELINDTEEAMASLRREATIAGTHFARMREFILQARDLEGRGQNAQIIPLEEFRRASQRVKELSDRRLKLLREIRDAEERVESRFLTPRALLNQKNAQRDLETKRESLDLTERELATLQKLLDASGKFLDRSKQLAEGEGELPIGPDLKGMEAALDALQEQLKLLEKIKAATDKIRFEQPIPEGQFERALEIEGLRFREFFGFADEVDRARLKILESANAADLLAASIELGFDAQTILNEQAFRGLRIYANKKREVEGFVEQLELAAELLSARPLFPEPLFGAQPELVTAIPDPQFELPVPTDEELDKWQEDLEKLISDARWDAIFEGMTQGLQESFSDTFESIFDEGLEGFKSFFEGIRELFINILSEFMAAELKRVILEQISLARSQAQAAKASGEGGGILNQLISGRRGTALSGALIAANIAAAESRADAAIVTALGAGIGAAVGAMAGPITVAAGAKLGAIIGSIVGSFIKRGTPEFFAAIEAELGQIRFSASDMGGGAGRVAFSLGKDIREGISRVLDQFGADLLDIAPGVTLKLKNGLSVFLDNIEFDFGDDLAEGVSFAIAQILKRADLSGVEPEILQALQASGADSVDELVRDLQDARNISRLALDDITKEILGFLDDAEVAARRARELGIDEAPVWAFLAEQMGTLRDQILGISEDPAARVERQAQAFNARLQLIRAEEEARLAENRIRAADLRAELEMLRAEAGLSADRLSLMRANLEIEATIVDAQGDLLHARLEQLRAVEAALEASERILSTLPDLISGEEIEQAIRRTRSGGRGRQDEREELRRLAQEARLGTSVAADIFRAAEAFAELEERVRRAGFSAEEAGRLIDAFADARDRDREDALRGLRQRIAALDMGDLESSLEALADQVAALHRELDLLESTGELAADEIRRLREELEEGAQTTAQRTADEAGQSLLGDLLDALGREEEVARLRQELAFAELLIRREELRIAQERFGLEVQALDRIDELLGELAGLGPEGLAAAGRLGSRGLSDVQRDIGALGTSGGLMGSLASLDEEIRALEQDLLDLEAAGRASAEEVERASKALEQQARAARGSAILSDATQFLLQMLDAAGLEEEAARLRFDLALLEMELRREEIRLALAKSEIETETALRIIEILGRSEGLIERIRRAGPSRGRTTGGRRGDDSRDRALELLERKREESLGAFVQEIRLINAEFGFLRRELGATAEIAELHRKAIEEAIEGIRDSTRSLLEQIDLTTPSEDPLDRFLELERRAREALSEALAAPTDIEARRRAESLLQELFQRGQEVLPTAGGGFRSLVDFIRSGLESLLGLEIDAGALGESPLGPQSDPGFDRVVDAINRQTDALLRGEMTIADQLAAILTAEQRNSLSDLGEFLAGAIDLQGGDFATEVENLMRLLDLLTDEQIAALGGIESIIFRLLGSDGPQAAHLVTVASLLRLLDANQLASLGGIEALMLNLADIENSSEDWLRALVQTVGWEQLENLGLMDDVLKALHDGFAGITPRLGGPVPDPTPRLGSGGSQPSGSGGMTSRDVAAAMAVRDQTADLVVYLRDIRTATQLSASELQSIRRLMARPTTVVSPLSKVV